MATLPTTLSDKFSLKGSWWLRETPDRKVTGLLAFDPDGSTILTLDGTLREIPKGEYHPLSVPVILGHTHDGKACTVLDAHESNLQMHGTGTLTTRFSYRQVFVGREFVNSEQVLFESALIQLTHLPAWLHRDPFTVKYNHGSHKTRQVVTTYTMPKMINVPVHPLQASIRFEPTVNSNCEYQKHVIRHSESVRIKPKTKQSLEWFLDVTFKFRMLLSLFVDKAVNFTSMRFCVKKRKLPNLGGKLHREYLDFCFKQVGTLESKTLLPPEIPFTYPSIRRDIRRIFEAWFGNAEDLRTTYELYFGVTVNRDTPAEFAFLALIQALEAFHRAIGEDEYVSDSAYAPTLDALVGAIPPTVPQDLRSALKARLKYGNEYSLRKRLNRLLTRIPDGLLSIITEADSRFIHRVVATRNYLTHRDESQKSDVMDFAEMFNGAESLKLIIAFLLLTETGIHTDTVSQVMRTHWAYRNRVRVLTNSK